MPTGGKRTGGGPGDGQFDYVAHDQKNATNLGTRAKTNPASTAFDKGVKNEHAIDVQKDIRPMATRLGAAQANSSAQDHAQTGNVKDPTMAAKMHGNQPSKGARIDKELMEDDEKRLEEKRQSKQAKGKTMNHTGGA